MTNLSFHRKQKSKNKACNLDFKSDSVSELLNSKSKVAPRSGLQFKVGPPFQDTIQVSQLFIKESHQKIVPVLNARIDRGFDLTNNEWVGYKRNYFSVVASFSFEEYEINKSILPKNGFFIVSGEKEYQVKQFAIRLVSKSVQDNTEISLIQHTAKRDRGPISEPPIVPVITGSIPSHIVVKEGSNIRKISKIRQFDSLFFQDYKTLPILQSGSILNNYDKNKDYVKVVKYERIQFSSAINCKKQSITEKKRFILQIQLLAALSGENTYAIIAISNTPSLIIRGRSPSSYNSRGEGIEQSQNTECEEDVQSFLTTTANDKYTVYPESRDLGELSIMDNLYKNKENFEILKSYDSMDSYTINTIMLSEATASNWLDCSKLDFEEHSKLELQGGFPDVNIYSSPGPTPGLLEQESDPELLEPSYFLMKARTKYLQNQDNMIVGCQKTFSNEFFNHRKQAANLAYKIFEDGVEDDESDLDIVSKYVTPSDVMTA